uniref:Uncharacterized protein n=1 Tax=Oryza sativa subsp. japonica TaxID=39947 RepID=Q5Z6U0_ORYSJ|nr:hypothetical protein [Oryza sativa Japonica Group]
MSFADVGMRLTKATKNELEMKRREMVNRSPPLPSSSSSPSSCRHITRPHPAAAAATSCQRNSSSSRRRHRSPQLPSSPPTTATVVPDATATGSARIWAGDGHRHQIRARDSRHRRIRAWTGCRRTRAARRYDQPLPPLSSPPLPAAATIVPAATAAVSVWIRVGMATAARSGRGMAAAAGLSGGQLPSPLAATPESLTAAVYQAARRRARPIVASSPAAASPRAHSRPPPRRRRRRAGRVPWRGEERRR